MTKVNCCPHIDEGKPGDRFYDYKAMNGKDYFVCAKCFERVRPNQERMTE